MHIYIMFFFRVIHQINDLLYLIYSYIFRFDFKGIIDYIFHARETIRPLGVLGPLDQDWFIENKVLGCPHPHIPSDHLPLLVEFEMNPISSLISGSGAQQISGGSIGGSVGNIGNRPPSGKSIAPGSGMQGNRRQTTHNNAHYRPVYNLSNQHVPYHLDTGNTLQRSWRFDLATYITMHVVSKKHSTQIF